jgi:prolipoprotein diacylglyceryltransferase
MHPEIVGLSSYFTMWAVAAAAGVTIALRQATRDGIAPRTALGIVLAVAVLVVVGAKGQALLQEAIFGRPPIGVNAAPAANPLTRGFQVPGGVALVFLGLPLLCAIAGVSTRGVSDAVIPALWAALAVARFGCFLHGCCFGTVADVPWAVRFPPTSPAFAWHFHARWVTDQAPASLPVHPLQLYFVALCAGLYIAGRWWLRHRPWVGFAGLATGLGYFGGTFGLELLRQERIHLNLLVTAAGVLSLLPVIFFLTVRHQTR